MDNPKINKRFDKLENLINELKVSMTSRYKELDSKLTEVVKSQQFLSEKYEEINTRLITVEQQKCELAIENTSLKAQVLKSSNDLHSLQQEVNNLEQYIRRDCLEIRGIPEQDNETVDMTNDLVQRVGEMIGVLVEEKDISISHRLSVGRNRSMTNGSRPRGPKSVIVKFANRQTRDDYYRARLHLRSKSTEDLGFQNQNKIFIVESLTQRNKELFNRCLNFKREKGYKYIWTQMGKIYLRKDTESVKIHVACPADLERLLDR